MRKGFLRVTTLVLVVLAIGLVSVGFWGHGQIAGSLPLLDGKRRLRNLNAEVTIERDSLGIPTIHAANRLDLAKATGFLHAQDRFFQMDLLRRNSAGELSALVGPSKIAADKRVRVHRFREAARRVLAAGSDEDRAIVDAYASGVNAGLACLPVKPFEYLLLGLEPEPWKSEDSSLVMFSMFLDLQENDFRDEARLGLMHDILPEPLFEFLAPRGTEWDAPVEGEAFAVPATPGPEVFDTHRSTDVALLAPPGSLTWAESGHLGSNNWAIGGARTADGRALVADDMHLGFSVPHIWYRASFVWEDAGEKHQMTGLSLPGTPAIIVGSNGHVAWAFTNSEGDWVDVVIVEVDPNDPDSYRTPDGMRKFEHVQEKIEVKGAADETLEVVSTIWGPVIDHDQHRRPRAWRWVAHDTEGVNLNSLRLESAPDLETALRIANQSGAPAQNFVVGDDRGRIAWTIMGRIPKRVGFDGRLPSSWADGSHRWDGYLSPEEYPRIIDPEGGRLWTANARVVSGEMLAKLGDGGYDLGARAQQIRDDLRALDKMSEADMLKIQLDDRAVFLTRWQKLLLDTLSPEATSGNPPRAELRKYVENWGERADKASVGFRAVRAFRSRLLAQVSDVLVSPCKAFDPKFSISGLDRTEGPVWRLVSERPEHLIDPRYKDWNAVLLAAVDQVLEDATTKGKLADYTWGAYNTTLIQHPLSKAVRALAPWLDMPQQALSGDTDNIPRIQAPTRGASQRMAVSPGHEADGYMHMPCGQSGHPLSPHYRDGHRAWAEGLPTPFMPGPTVHTLVLVRSVDTMPE